MKSRFNALDLRAITQELQPLLAGARVLNIYDHANRSFVIKLVTPAQKHYLIIEPGVRLHLSQDALLRIEQQQKKQPTGLVMKLRKCLKGRRLMRVEQCGWDRSVRLEFGYYQSTAANAEAVDDEGEEGNNNNNEFETVKALNLFVEFFSQGNLILCEPDDDNKVLAISRPITDIPGIPELIIGSHYSPNTAPMPVLPMLEQCQGIFRINKPKELKNALRSTFSLLPLYYLDSCKSISPDYFYIQAKQFYGLALQSPLTINAAVLSDSEFLPILPPSNVHTDDDIQMCASFNEAVDKYFLKQEEESAKSKQHKLEESAQAKLQAIQGEQQARIDALRASIDLALKKAQKIEEQGDMVQAVCAVIKVAVDNGMDWRELEDLIREEKRNQRPTALLIKKLKLERQLVEIALDDLDVDINYTLSLHGNANWYYEQRKQAIAKLERTLQASAAALRSAKAKIDADLHAKRTATSRALIRSTKRTLWFEKYAWFLSSDGYLVLAGHDAQQNDILVKRHLLKDDLYVHAQVNGAASVIIKNHLGGDREVPPRTLNEAGCFSVLHSRAWEGKVMIGSWWVRAEQVSKTAPSGEYLSTGAFMVRGRKNFIPPAPLQAGFGFLFLCANARKKEEEEREKEAMEELREKYERALEVTEEDQQEDAVELVESGNVLLPNVVQVKKPQQQQQQKQQKAKLEEPSKMQTNSGGVRGKKGKMKKMKSKYKDQDEEERQIKMALLGNPTANPTTKTDTAMTCTNTAKIEEKQKEEKVTKNKTKSVVVMEEAAPMEEFSVLDHLHHTLGDTAITGHVQQAIPVCGPWSALKNYQFRVKLVPQVGSGPGKGKLCKNIVALLTCSSAKLPQGAAELIRAVTDVDMQHALSLNKCAMQLGATDSQALRKHNKKSSKSKPKQPQQ